MLNTIAKITGFRCDEKNVHAMDILNRIHAKLPEGVNKDTPQLEMLVESAEKEIDEASKKVFASLTGIAYAATDPAPPKVLKIKSSPKGDRIEIPAANGIRYSFGPIWNASVLKGKGVAFADANRAKLMHQAEMLGIKNADELSINVLASRMAKLVSV